MHQALYVARRALAGSPTTGFTLRDDLVLLSDGPQPWLDIEALAELEWRAGDVVAAGRCLDDARGHFVALGDVVGLGLLVGGAERLLRQR